MDMISVTIKITSKEKMETSSIHFALLSNLNVNSLSKISDDFDTVYIAHCYPYTYSKLQLFLKDL